MSAPVVLQQQTARHGPAPAPVGDAWAFWSAETIAQASGSPLALASVRKNWPLIFAALSVLGIADRVVCAAVIGTVGIETAHTWEPVREAFWLSEAWRRANLRYYPWYGRGFVQLTWEDGYRKAGEALGVDLLADPDRAMNPEIAADVLAWYVNTHGGGPLIPAAARRGDWREVRRLVQGGSAGLDELIACADALQAA